MIMNKILSSVPCSSDSLCYRDLINLPQDAPWYCLSFLSGQDLLQLETCASKHLKSDLIRPIRERTSSVCQNPCGTKGLYLCNRAPTLFPTPPCRHPRSPQNYFLLGPFGCASYKPLRLGYFTHS